MGTTIRLARFSAIDFESAGHRRGGTEVPVQLGMATMECLVINASFQSYLACADGIAWRARAVHGITDEQIAGAPALPDLWPEISRGLRHAFVVAHGAGTEKRFLRAFPLHGFGPWIDTLELTRALHPELECHSLGALCDHFGLLPEIASEVDGFRWHDALSDAVASLVLLRFLTSSAGLLDEDALILTRPDTRVYRRVRTASPNRSTPREPDSPTPDPAEPHPRPDRKNKDPGL